jgi:hypothetical protein
MCEDDAQPPVTWRLTTPEPMINSGLPPKYHKYHILLYNPVTMYNGPGQRVTRVFRLQ